MAGRHVIVSGKGHPQSLGGKANVERFVNHLVEALGMRKLDNLVIEVEPAIEKLGKVPFEDEGGVTAVAVLSTSHVAIHTWPLRECFELDVYSCRDFEPGIVLDMVQAYFGAGEKKLTNVTYAHDN